MHASRTSLRTRQLLQAAAMVMAFLALILGNSGNASARTYASIVVDANSGRVIHEVNADARIYPASLTKMMSLYLLFEALENKKIRPSDTMRASRRAVRQPPSKLGLKPGQAISVEAAIKALVVKSANDVAVTVAEHLGQTESGFAAMMTRKAKSLGMSGTVFRNASGLPHKGQFSTARDLMRLSLSLKRDFPSFYRYFSVQSFDYAGTTLQTHNRVLKDYDGADGLKTGYINASGFNVATSARRGNVALIGVVIGGKTASSRDRHMMDLLDKGFRAAGAPLLPEYRSAQYGSRPDTNPNIPEPRKVSAALPRKPDSNYAVRATETWGIQVGAFKGLASADKEAKRAASALKSGQGIPLVTPASPTGSSKALYRARLIGFATESKARVACRTLKKKAFRCSVVSPESVEVAMTP